MPAHRIREYVSIMENNDKKSGPIVRIAQSLAKKDLKSIADLYISSGSLKESDKLILTSMQMAALTATEFSDNDYIYFRSFDGFDIAEQHDNPDIKNVKNRKKLSLKRPTRYRRLKKLCDVGFLLKRPHSDAPEALNLYSSNAAIYEITLPKDLPSEVTDSDFNARSAEYRQSVLKEKQLLNNDINYLSRNDISKMGTQKLSNYVSRSIKPTSTYDKKTIINEFPIPIGENELPGMLKITTTALDNSGLMDDQDMLLVDYIYAKIKWHLEERKESFEFVGRPIENKFKFDIVQILKDFNLPDTGGYRRSFWSRFDRISSTEFQLEVSENVRWLMNEFGFLDEENRPFDRVRFNILKIYGETFDDEEVEDTQQRQVPRIISVSLPTYIMDRINAYFNDQASALLPMFQRDPALLTESNAGYMWVLYNYLKSQLPREMNYRRPMTLEGFLKKWRPPTSDDIWKSTFKMFDVLLEPSRLLFVQGLDKNIRREYKVDRIISQVHEYLISITNSTPNRKRKKDIVYVISILHMPLVAKKLCTVQRDNIEKSGEWLQSETFINEIDSFIDA